MSWSASASGNRDAIDGHVRLMFAQARGQIGGHPPSEQALRVHHAAVEEFLKTAPFHSSLAIASHGHFDHDGHGSATLKLEIGAEVPEVAPEPAAAEAVPAAVTPEEALLEHHDEPPVSSPDA